ncbi:DUF397 domain-containing protein [Streptomyces sp. NPDC020607]|uniref:DUF397 domain-containing protein n=1 Tax=Streptomyces sp. NPDC020607 TaxID=3365082 RepID=UPI00379BC874
MSAPTWQKSTFSDGSDGDTCVELAPAGTCIRLRESEDPATELTAAPETFAGLLRALRAGKPPSRQP